MLISRVVNVVALLLLLSGALLAPARAEQSNNAWQGVETMLYECELPAAGQAESSYAQATILPPASQAQSSVSTGFAVSQFQLQPHLYPAQRRGIPSSANAPDANGYYAGGYYLPAAMNSGSQPLANPVPARR